MLKLIQGGKVRPWERQPEENPVSKVAALFVDPNGAYSKISDVELWDEARDARTYAGSWPVVAHPPCHLWVNLAGVNWKRYGKQKPAWYLDGNDGGCFASALLNVINYGGVIEHPAFTHAWAAFDLPRPQGIGWTHYPESSIWVCEVWQSAYGHKARKRTWLFYSGDRPPFELDWSRKAGQAQIGWFDRNKPTLGKREASATPPAFAELLVALARNSRGRCSN